MPHSSKNEDPLVSINIVNFNGRDMLRECLQSILKTKYSNYEIIVVDNGSADGSCTMVKREFPQVRLIKNQVNLGYSKGNNIGIRHSNGEFIVLLNNDTIVHPEWLSELIHEAKQNSKCFYQPKILFAGTKRINSAGNFINLFGFGFPRGIGEADLGQYDKKCEINYAAGACVLASKRLVKIVGLLDEEDFFTFYEDVNWGWRASMLGYKSIYVPSAVIYHKWGGSWGATMSSKKFFLIERSRLATLFRNYSSRTLISMLPAFILVELLVLLYSILNGFVSEKIRAYADFLRSMNLLIKQKRELQNRRRKSDIFIVKSFSEGFTHLYLGVFNVPINKFLAFISKIVKRLVR